MAYFSGGDPHHSQGIVGCTPIPTYPYGKSLYKPYISLYSGCLWVIIPKNPYISPIGTMGTLLGVHPIVPWHSITRMILQFVFPQPPSPPTHWFFAAQDLEQHRGSLGNPFRKIFCFFAPSPTKQWKIYSYQVIPFEKTVITLVKYLVIMG